MMQFEIYIVLGVIGVILVAAIGIILSRFSEIILIWTLYRLYRDYTGGTLNYTLIVKSFALQVIYANAPRNEVSFEISLSISLLIYYIFTKLERYDLSLIVPAIMFKMSLPEYIVYCLICCLINMLDILVYYSILFMLHIIYILLRVVALVY